MLYGNMILRMASRLLLVVAVTVGSGLASALDAGAVLVSVEVENLAPSGGSFLTPVWVGFHDGSFDLFSPGQAASAGLEQIAEDGAAANLDAMFSAAQPNGLAGLVTGPGGMIGDDTGEPPVIDPGETTAATLDVDGSVNRYMSFATMVIPSNDAFIGNGDPMAIELFDSSGRFLGPRTIMVAGSMVWDAGTEENTEMDAAFINQAAGNTGVTTVGGTVQLHEGFIGSQNGPSGEAIILGGSNGLGANFDAVAADFTRDGHQVARITIVPEPATGLVVIGIALCGCLTRNRRVQA